MASSESMTGGDRLLCFDLGGMCVHFGLRVKFGHVEVPVEGVDGRMDGRLSHRCVFPR